MRLFGIHLLVTGWLVLLVAVPVVCAEAPGPAPDFQEVYDLIRGHLPGVSEAELNRAAVQGLVTALGPKVSLVGRPETPAAGETPLVSGARLFEDRIAYLRIGRVEDGLALAVREAYGGLASTNQLNGVVLDLRYATGQNFNAAAATADLFLKKERPLLDLGQGPVRSKEKDDALAGPVAVLVNHQTAGAAEALAAVLRETGAGLVLGSPTAGQAMIAQEYPLKNGERLRLATAPIRLGDGSALASSGVQPDIAVEVNARDEQAYYADAFRELGTNLSAGASLSQTNAAASATNRLRRPRFNEAELVRERRDGISAEAAAAPAREGEAERPLVRDPVLARALDVLKGLSVVRQTRS